jgi:hypothetical protein
MAPMMWYTLSPDLDATSNRALATLLHPQNGIIPHIRDLFVSGAEDRIRLLLSGEESHKADHLR